MRDEKQMKFCCFFIWIYFSHILLCVFCVVLFPLRFFIYVCIPFVRFASHFSKSKEYILGLYNSDISTHEFPFYFIFIFHLPFRFGTTYRFIMNMGTKRTECNEWNRKDLSHVFFFQFFRFPVSMATILWFAAILICLFSFYGRFSNCKIKML